MKKYICPKCGKVFDQKNNLDYHVNHNSCKELIYMCKYCDKGFTTKNSMWRHMKHNCKTKKEKDTEKQTTFELLKTLAENKVSDNIELKNLRNENKQLREDMEKIRTTLKIMESSFPMVSNTVNNMNINNGIVNNNIILVGYGNEDMSKLSKLEILNAIQNGYESTVKLTGALHFNPKYPEYHNVYISNMKDKYAMMFDGEKWILVTKEDLIDKIYGDKKNYIEENLEEFIGSLLPSRKRALDRWLATDDNDTKVKRIKDNIKLLLYNEKQIVIDNKDLHTTNIRITSNETNNTRSIKRLKDKTEPIINGSESPKKSKSIKTVKHSL
jgi:hypothetical protein